MEHTGKETTPSPHHATGCAAHPSILFSPPGHGFSTLDARWKPLIGQDTSGIMRGDTVGLTWRTLMADNPNQIVSLSNDEKDFVVQKKATCPFIGSAVSQGDLAVRNDARNPLASLEDVRA